MSRHRLSSLSLLVLLALGGCSGSECSCIGPPVVVTGVAITGLPSIPLRVGNKVFLTAQIQANGVIADRRVTWLTSSAMVVEVDEHGLITAVGPGTATVEAIPLIDTTKRGSITVRVEQPPASASAHRVRGLSNRSPSQ